MRISVMGLSAAWIFAELLVAPSAVLGQGHVGAGSIYSFDRSHSRVEFSVRFIGLTDVKGTFNMARGTLVYDDNDVARSSITVVIETESIDTNNDFRDRDLKTNFFHVERYPYIVFQSSRIEESPDGFIAHGSLDMHGVTKQVSIPFVQLHRPQKGIWNMTRVGFTGNLKLNRKDYGVVGDAQWNVPFDLDRRAIGDEVSIQLIVQALRVDWRDRGYRSDPRQSIGEILESTIAEEGIEAAVATYNELRANRADDINFDRSELQLLGRRLLQEEHVRKAIAIHELNAAAYPTAAATHANLGRAYAAAGNVAEAKAAYETALELNPVQSEALEMLRRLGGT